MARQLSSQFNYLALHLGILAPLSHPFEVGFNFAIEIQALTPSTGEVRGLLNDVTAKLWWRAIQLTNAPVESIERFYIEGIAESGDWRVEGETDLLLATLVACAFHSWLSSSIVVFFSFTFPAPGRTIEPRIILGPFSHSAGSSIGAGWACGRSICPAMGRNRAVIPRQAR